MGWRAAQGAALHHWEAYRRQRFGTKAGENRRTERKTRTKVLYQSHRWRPELSVGGQQRRKSPTNGDLRRLGWRFPPDAIPYLATSRSKVPQGSRRPKRSPIDGDLCSRCRADASQDRRRQRHPITGDLKEPNTSRQCKPSAPSAATAGQSASHKWRPIASPINVHLSPGVAAKGRNWIPQQATYRDQRLNEAWSPTRTV